MICIFYGRGKGKTSAAVGAALRAAGQGWPVLVVQFMKDARAGSGEVTSFRELSTPVEVMRAIMPYSIFRPPGRKALAELKNRTSRLFHDAVSRIRAGSYRLVVLDELGVAVSRRWITAEAVAAMLDDLADNCDVIITGRIMPRWLLERADLVTQMRKIKHPFDKGVKARKGLEF